MSQPVPFVHLHNHTHYSILDGACTPRQLVEAAAADDQPAVAITDHGVMFGCLEFYKEAKAAGLKPILGCEVYMAVGSRFDRPAPKQRNYYHLVLLAKNEQGYRNLIKLVTLAHLEGYYYRPRIDWELLERYHDGLIALSGCLIGVVNAHIVAGDYQTAYRTAAQYRELFGEDFYLELQWHNLPEDHAVLASVPRIARELKIPMVVTNDCHYIRKEHALAHNVLLHIREVGSARKPVDITQLRYRQPEMYVKTAAEMARLFPEHLDALARTVEIAEKCTLELRPTLHMPHFPIPPEAGVSSLEAYLEQLVWQGLRHRYGEPLPAEVRERARYELDVITRMGFAGYFLIVQDFIAAARRMGVRVGPGRGSVVGSLVAYALGITSLDPLPYQLLFERFLNPERVSMPDIDVDFSDDKRDRVIDYVRRKYGEESVAQIITFGTLSSRAVIKDVGRVLGIAPSVLNAITEKIPVVLGKVTPLEEALQLPDLQWLRQTDDPKLRQLVEFSLVLEGFCRNISVHAAGVVIAPGPVSEYVPLCRAPSGEIVTQYSMRELEDAGLLKMDFLGLRTLSIIDNTIEMVRRTRGQEIDIDAVDLTDADTYQLLASGKTLGIFQFEAETMQEALRELKPSSLEDLVALNALNRPGPMEYIPEFIARKHGRKPIEYLHPAMEPILRTTYGIIIYQEQVMQLAQAIAGFSLAQADLMRRAMGKKDQKLMQQQRDAFLRGAVRNGIPEELAEQIFALIERFASYGFNKSHALAYAYLAYQTAYLKAHFPAEFLAANMTAESGNQEKLAEFLRDARALGITVLPPDINRSEASFQVLDEHTIIFGLAGIKNVGTAAVEELVRARRSGGPFRSLFDLVRRTDARVLNRRALEALIAAGALDSLRLGHRAQLMAAVEAALEYARASAEAPPMESLFGSPDVGIAEPELPSVPPWSLMEQLQREREVLGLYLSAHPLQEYEPLLGHLVVPLKRLQAGAGRNGAGVRIAAVITAVERRRDRQQRPIAFIQLEDTTGQAEAICWHDVFATAEPFLREGELVLLVGRVEPQERLPRIVATAVEPLEQGLRRLARGFRLELPLDEQTEELIYRLHQLQQRGMSGCPVVLHLCQDNVPVRTYVVPHLGVELSLEGYRELVQLLPEGRISLWVE
ncbi:DNA polymerase III subunit alpha [bacterium HR21]|nr:DNA polymerase III subunit alpha [bacterium HR21]